MHLAALAPLHCDPFDRLLVAQAIQHGLTIATIDPEIAAYSGTVAARPDLRPFRYDTFRGEPVLGTLRIMQRASV